MSETGEVNPIQRARALTALKGQRRITALTAYDYPTARFLDRVGIDLTLVGDSLGMVVLGYADTTHVTLDQMEHHTAAVARGNHTSLIVSDLPIDTYDNPKQATKSALRLVTAGAHAVKLEGGQDQVHKILAIIERDIPVVGHLGMLPQSVLVEGGYKKKGKAEEEIVKLKDDVKALCDVGVSAIVLESIVPEVAKELTALSTVPTIGIGCGETTCDGEVAVITDVIGSYPWFVPPFAKPEADVATVITEALERYVQRVSG